LVGTDIGIVLQLLKKGGTNWQKEEFDLGKHHGPVLAVKRNPILTKYFLSVGDWTAKIWADDFKQFPLVTTKYNDVLLTDGAWSPTKPGLFFLSKSDGWLDAWDYFYRRNEPAFS